MPHADKDDRFQPITLEWEYRRLSRGKRLAIELSVGMAILAMIPIGVSMQLPPWLQLIGWAILLSSLVGQSVLVVRWWRERERARESASGAGGQPGNPPVTAVRRLHGRQ